MTVTIACPTSQRWQQIIQGMLGDDDAEALHQHVNSCETCAQRLRTLSRDETLENSLRQGTAADTPVPEPVLRLMERLKQLPILRPVNDQTVGLESQAPARAEPQDEITQEIYASFDAAQGSDEIGRLGAYRVLKLLGSGGMGAVFLAEDVSLQRQVALKVMRPGVAANPQARDRFLREARACAALKHDNIVTIYQVGEERGVPFLAMELLEGMPLDALLESGRKLSVVQMLRIGREIARGLAAAHEKGLIHRDIKPANIWLDKESGRVKILDFGLARNSAEDVQLTQSGTIIGTPAYMAPEQARGGKVDGRTDLFSLGALLYRVCAGTNPFSGSNTLAVLTSLALDTPKPVAEVNPAIPPALSALIARLMAKDPAGRPESAKAVIAELQAIERSLATQTAVVAPTPVPTAPVVAKQPEPKSAPTRSRSWVLVAAVALGLIGLSVVLALTVYTIKTDKGTLVVEIDDPDVNVMLKQNGVVVVDGKTMREFTLNVGEGELVVTDKEGVTLTTKTFAIKKGEQTRVSVTLEGRAAVKPPVMPMPPLGEGASPFDSLRRDAIPAEELAIAGGGESKAAPKELVAILGSGRFNHHSFVITQAYSPDGKQLAAAGYLQDPAIRIWDSATGWPRSNWTDGKFTTNALAYSPDGKTLAAGRGDRTVRLYRADNGQLTSTISVHDRDVRHVLYHPDGKRLLFAAGSPQSAEPGVVIAWEVETGKELWRVTLEKSSITALALSPDGKILAGASPAWGEAVVLWDADSGKELRRLKDLKNSLVSLAFSPDGKYLAVGRSGQQPRGVLVIEVATGLTTRTLTTNGQTLAVAFSPDGKWIAGQSDDNRVTVWKVSGGAVVAELTAPRLSGYATLAFRPTGGQLALSCGSGGLVTWDTGDWSSSWPERGPTGRTDSLAVSADGRWIVAGGLDGIVRVWDAGTSKRVAAWENASEVKGVAISPDSSRVAAGTHRGPCVWERATGRVLFTSNQAMQNGHGVAFSPDGARLAFANWSKLGVLDAATGQPTREAVDLKSSVIDLGWSPDGKLIACAGGFGTRLVAADGKIDELTTTSEFKGMAISPEGRWLLRRVENKLKFWDMATRAPVQPWGPQPIPAEMIACSFDGKLVAHSTATSITWRDAATGKIVGSVATFAEVHRLEFAPDGRHLISANVNGTLAVYRLADAKTPVPVQPARSALDGLQREKIDPEELAVAGGGDANGAAKQLVGIIGSTRLNQNNTVTGLAFRPDGSQLAAIYHGAKPALLWDPKTGRRTGSIDSNGLTFSTLTYSPDGKVLALGSNFSMSRAAIWLVNPDNQQTIRTLNGHQFGLSAVRFSPDGKRLYSASMLQQRPSAGEIIAWNLESGEKLWTVPVAETGVADLVLGKDGKELLALCGEEVRVLDAADGKEIRKIAGHKGIGKKLEFNSATGQIAVSREENLLQILDLATGKELNKQSLSVYGSFGYSPDGKQLALGDPKIFQILDAGWQVVREFSNIGNSTNAVAFSPDGATLATGHHSGGVALWNVATGERRWPDSHIGRLRTASVSGDGSKLVTVGEDNTTRIWDIATGTMERTLKLKEPAAAVFFPKGTLAAGIPAGYLGVYDAKTGNEKWQIPGQGSTSPTRLAVSPDGSRILTHKGTSLRVLDAATGGELLLTEPFSAGGYLKAMAWSPDGKWIGSTHSQPVEVATGKSPFPQEESRIEYHGVAFSPDGRTFVKSTNKTVERWDLTTLKKLEPFPSDTGYDQLAFTPDGRWLLGLNSNGRTLTILDATGGKLVRSIPLPQGSAPNSLAVAADGRHVIVGNVFGASYVYRLDDGK